MATSQTAVDLFGFAQIPDAARIEEVLAKAAHDAGAVIVGRLFHTFPGGGVTGVLLLAESHIAIHTWPEEDYAALDILMCGGAEAALAAESVARGLGVKTWSVQEVPRGFNRTTPPSPLHSIEEAGGIGSS
ncbi:MAG: adenosylmethionine decarboxylase [Pseudomonadota bacterium]